MKKLLSFLLMTLVACTVKAQGTATATSSTGENITITANGITFTMVFVKGGSFTMGATAEQGNEAKADEKPAHNVTLSDYYIGETEVTQALWQAVMGDDNPSEYKGPGMPVELISWEDCESFIDKLNTLTGMKFRLPTEAEWEYAARGGNKSRGYKFAGSNDIGTVAWYEGNSDAKTHPVKQKAPNELGIYDMTGNVWEFVWDIYGEYDASIKKNPSGPEKGRNRVLRGGGFNDVGSLQRVSARWQLRQSGYCGNYAGFRLARNVD